mgnify:CR=1 FL=1
MMGDIWATSVQGPVSLDQGATPAVMTGCAPPIETKVSCCKSIKVAKSDNWRMADPLSVIDQRLS